uniref:Uncharacterized protein n=1 Tax=Bracon brevicornis TaxID=1563983 RepID=A0A6V7L2F2_9HYME
MMKKVTIFLGFLAIIVVGANQFEEQFHWQYIDIVWPSDEIKTKAADRNEYIAANNAITGIKLWKGKIYLSVPRWRAGVPITLGVISAQPIARNVSPKLEAYPTWDMQTVGDCSAFQFVQSMEIDPKGRMWVLDSGRTETMTTEPKARCSPRLVILDLENNGEVLRNIPFPENITPHNDSFLNDIVLDSTDGGYAYITDSNNADPGIIVFSLKLNKSWKIRHNSMRADHESVVFKIGADRFTKEVPVDGIALSEIDAPERKIFYCPLSSYQLYSIPTRALKNDSIKDIHEYVSDLGRKSSQTDGMMMSANGTLYFGLLADDAVSRWDIRREPYFNTGQRMIARDHIRMQFPDTFAIDEEGFLWVTTNSLHKFVANQVDINQYNYRLVRLFINQKNYQYHQNGSIPELPDVPASAGHHLPLGIGALISLVSLYILQ